MKRSLLLIAIIVLSSSAFSQVYPGFRPTWYLSFGAGSQVYVGEYDKMAPIFQRITPAIDLSLGRWFTPSLGARIHYSGFNAKGATLSIHPYADEESFENGFYKESFEVTNIHVDFLFNYTQERRAYYANEGFQIIPFLGFGWVHSTKNGTSFSSDKIGANTGVIGKVVLSKKTDFNTEIRAMLVNESFDGVTGGRWGEGMLTITLGFSFKL